jgi:ABC-2 type transport system ATP-binding protein
MDRLSDEQLMATALAGEMDALAALVERAVGRVWTVTVDQATAERLQATHRISALVSRPSGILLRIVSEIRPHDAAVPVEPSLEDAYLLVTGAQEVAA